MTISLIKNDKSIEKLFSITTKRKEKADVYDNLHACEDSMVFSYLVTTMAGGHREFVGRKFKVIIN